MKILLFPSNKLISLILLFGLSSIYIVKNIIARKVLVGSWKAVPLTETMENLLFDSVSEPANYQSYVGKYICIHSIISLREQVVSGMNYNYIVNGCTMNLRDVPFITSNDKCMNCLENKKYEVTLWVQGWLDKSTITSIVPVDDE